MAVRVAVVAIACWPALAVSAPTSIPRGALTPQENAHSPGTGRNNVSMLSSSAAPARCRDVHSADLPWLVNVWHKTGTSLWGDLLDRIADDAGADAAPYAEYDYNIYHGSLTAEALGPARASGTWSLMCNNGIDVQERELITPANLAGDYDESVPAAIKARVESGIAERQQAREDAGPAPDGVRIVHMVRDPLEIIASSYTYHRSLTNDPDTSGSEQEVWQRKKAQRRCEELGYDL